MTDEGGLETPPERWVVGLIGDEHDLSELAAHLAGTIEISMSDPDGWEISTDRFQQLAEAGAIREAALELVSMLNGLAAVRMDAATPIRVGNVRRYRHGGKDVWAIADPINLRLRTFAPTVLINGVAPQPTPWSPAIELADRSEAVRSVLAFLGIQPPTWHSLHAALEVILGDPRTDGRRGVVAWGGVSNSQISRFTHTANSWPVLGVDARHGPEKREPPKNPIAMPDAVEFVRRLSQAWLDELIRRGA